MSLKEVVLLQVKHTLSAQGNDDGKTFQRFQDLNKCIFNIGVGCEYTCNHTDRDTPLLTRQ